MNLEILGKLASGETVYDREYEPHLETKSIDMLQLLPKAFSETYSCDEHRIAETIKFPSKVGVAHCIDTTKLPLDDIYYAMIRKKGGYSRFIKNRLPVPTYNLSMVLVRRKIDNDYILIALHPGKNSQPEPWQVRALVDSQQTDPLAVVRAWKFWQNHAFVEGYKPIDESTIVHECPWKLRSIL